MSIYTRVYTCFAPQVGNITTSISDRACQSFAPRRGTPDVCAAYVDSDWNRLDRNGCVFKCASTRSKRHHCSTKMDRFIKLCPHLPTPPAQFSELNKAAISLGAATVLPSKWSSDGVGTTRRIWMLLHWRVLGSISCGLVGVLLGVVILTYISLSMHIE